MSIESSSGDQEQLPEVYYKVTSSSTKYGFFNITFEDKETEEVWEKLFDNATAKKAIFNTLLKELLVKPMEATDFSKLVNV